MIYQLYILAADTGTIVPFSLGKGIPNILVKSTSFVKLTAPLLISPSAPTGATGFEVRWQAEQIDIDVYSVTICGVSISQSIVSQKGIFSCYFDGTSWDVQFQSDQRGKNQIIAGTNVLVIPNTGSITLKSGKDKNFQRSANTVTLTGNSSVSLTTTDAQLDDKFFHQHSGGVTTGAFALTLYGQELTAPEALNGGVSIFSWFDGTVWRSQKMISA